VVGGAAVATVVILLGLLVASAATGRALAVSSTSPLEVKVVGHQWWWEVRYPGTMPSLDVTTANELHLPVGRPVQVELTAHDVIHSFWIPSLHGKEDLIPGRINTLSLQADRPGRYEGLCAEFCGLQHAHMAFSVVAEEEGAFQAWLQAQRQPSALPADAVQARGQQVFVETPCAMCHSVMGTPAGGRNGPDLTHVASRPYLAAGALENTPDHMAAWIRDPHHFKPGAKMPPTALQAADLQALFAYLGSLK
jgi:cytochrome c oxidase subunit 2